MALIRGGFVCFEGVGWGGYRGAPSVVWDFGELTLGGGRACGVDWVGVNFVVHSDDVRGVTMINENHVQLVAYYLKKRVISLKLCCSMVRLSGGVSQCPNFLIFKCIVEKELFF